MILSSYRNPPYRSPTPGESSSPPPGRSPKRKRNEPAGSNSPPLQIDTQIQGENASNTGSGPDSPRMKVAEKFKDLEIRQINPTKPRITDRQGAPRKRMKRNHAIVDSSSSSDPIIAETPYKRRSGQVDEVGEMPDLRTRFVSTTPSPSSAGSTTLPLDPFAPKTTKGEVEAAEQIPSPPPPTPVGPGVVIQVDRSVSPLPCRQELTPDVAALTWQEDEITGHEIDVTGDDDGEGINGIGFRPTPAIAFARQQKRKQQVNEWRAREAKEARQRRVERRRGDAKGATVERDDLNEDDVKRIVRFTGVG